MRRQMSSLLFGRHNWFSSLLPWLFCTGLFEERKKFTLFSILSLCNSSCYSFRPGTKSYLGKELNKFCPQASGTTFAFSSVFILLLHSTVWLKGREGEPVYSQAKPPSWCGTSMEELKWSGPGGGWIVLRRVAGVYCVHYIEQKDCTTRFAA